MAKKTQNWELKDRVYVLRKGIAPLTYTLTGRNIYWLTKKKGTKENLNIL